MNLIKGDDDDDDDDDEDNELFLWYDQQRRLALSVAGTISRDPRHRKSPTRRL